jgi:cytosine/adenosine deaminase-related metal-dependent hydrolase
VLLLADWVVPVSSAPLADAGMRVEGETISEVGPAAQLRARYGDEETRSFPRCALLPGLVNSHTHLELSAFRGFTRSSGFARWMLDLLLARGRLDPADYQASALWGAYQCLRCGTTSIADTAYDGPGVARAASEAGLRARVYQEVFGLDDTVLSAAMERLEVTVAHIQDEAVAASRDGAGRAAATGGAAAPLVEAGVSPHAPYTVSARLYRETARFARRTGLRLATHVAESLAEVELLAKGTGAIPRTYQAARMWNPGDWTPPGVSPVAYLWGADALGPQTLVIHAVQVDGTDIATLAAIGAAVAHCPRSNARLRCGNAPVEAFLAAGVPVGLGTDSLASNASLDMFAEMRAALRAAADRAAADDSDAGAVTAERVLRMATLDGAAALGWADRTGSLEPGKVADVIAVKLPSGRSAGAVSSRSATSGGFSAPVCGPPTPALQGGRAAPTGGVVDALVRSARASDVRMTMVAGRVLHEVGAAGGTAPPAVASGYATARRKLGLKV